jgi:transposase
VELNESYLGGTRKGKRGRVAAGKVIVFGLLKRGDKVYTKVVLETKITTIMPIIRRRIECLKNTTEFQNPASIYS